MKQKLTIELLMKEAKEFCERESKFQNSDLYGVTDGKAVGTYIEHKFQRELHQNYEYAEGSSAKGKDFPETHLNCDMKVTSIKQPQSSCPFKNAQQKIFGLGYNLLLFVYDKTDDPATLTATLDFKSCSLIKWNRTADYTITYRLRQMVDDGANQEDIVAYLIDRNIPADDITLNEIAKQLLEKKPEQGYLTISNALQWRLQYSRVVHLKDDVEGIVELIDKINE